jgi:hypothetical protein
MHAVRALTLIILSCEMSLQCQTLPPPVDIYAGFVGTWIGTGDSIKDGCPNQARYRNGMLGDEEEGGIKVPVHLQK